MINALKHDSPLFLASVLSVAEANLVLQVGGQLIDCKNPSAGALGALDAKLIRSVVEAVAGRAPVSATIGDLPINPGIMVTAAREIAATGVDIVKVGFFGESDPRAAISALGAADLERARIVAVLMADQHPDFEIISALAKAGFIGVMLDTADKSRGALPDVMRSKTLAEFVARARNLGLAAGLAGSLRLEHIAGLTALEPDILGFRGALCDGGRTAALNAAHVRAVRDAIDAAKSQVHPAQSRPSKRSVA
jgi:(5-formylfuran-3-yl)methyl phosphate synthase